MEPRALLATFWVTNTNDSGAGSLRQAMLNAEANVSQSPDDILFNISGTGQQVIQLQSPLPAITQPLTIRGYTQPGSVVNDSQNNDREETTLAELMVRIDGSNLGPGANGIVVNGPNSTISGLSITGFRGAGIVIETTNPNNPAVGNHVWGNFVGIDDFDELTRNPLTAQTNPHSNGEGIRVLSSNNRIGGTLPPSRNVIQANTSHGVVLAGAGGTGNLIQTNFILDNGGDGVRVTSSNNFVGEAVGSFLAGGGNVISGNQRGVHLLGTEARGNLVLNNEIGTDVGFPGVTPPVRGMSPRPNRAEGVLISNAPDNVIGGMGGNTRNVIASNGSDGIRIDGAEAVRNRVLNNWIGFNERDVISILPNRDGIVVTSPRNIIGAASEAGRNVIANNRHNGIRISGPVANRNTVQGNFIGTITGGDDFGNSFEGILIESASDNIIGGTTHGVRNVISGNNNGVVIRGASSTGNLVAGNYIGVASDGNTDLGNAVDGVVIDNAPRNRIGGTTSATRNVITGNDRGVRITGSQALENFVSGNYIGLGADGQSPTGNSIDGILITGNASNNTIGGSVEAAGNTIAYNVQSGVLVESGTGNSIVFNSIHSNIGLGIDLGGDGVTTNDPGDLDNGPNTRLNFPTLSTAVAGEARTNVQGEYQGKANSTLRLQFFSSPQADPSGFGEGQIFLGEQVIKTDANGRYSFHIQLERPVATEHFITATATDSAGNTSEFSNAVTAAPVFFQFAASSFSVGEAEGQAVVTVTRVGNTEGLASVTVSTADGTATEGEDYTGVHVELTFEPGQVNKSITIPILDDDLAEGPETVLLTLSDPTNSARLGAPSTATLTILDDEQDGDPTDPVVRFEFASYVVDENAGQIVVNIVRSPSDGLVTVEYATADGTATAGLDYLAVSGTLTFQPGVTSQQITIPILSDDLVEENETFTIQLSNPNGASLGAPNTATVIIADSSQPGFIGFSTHQITVLENAGVARVTVSRFGGQDGTVSVFYYTIEGNAVVGQDFWPVGGYLVFEPGETSKVIEIPIIDNTIIDGDRSFGVLLTDPTGGAALAPINGQVVTILNDDFDVTPPVITGLQFLYQGRGISGIILNFSEALDPQRAEFLPNYDASIRSTGRDGRFGTPNDVVTPIVSAQYDPWNFRVILTPSRPLARNQFHQLIVNPRPFDALNRSIADLAGNVLDGNGNGQAGGTYVARFFVGPQVSYVDADGDRVTLQLARAGLIEFVQGPSGDAQQVRLLGAMRGRSILQGFLQRRAGSGGLTPIPVLDNPGGAEIRLRTPPFLIG